MEQTTCLVDGVQPLQLPWTNNVLNTAGQGSARGVAVSIGTPPQFFSMVPDVASNNTFAVNVNLCKSAQNYSCVASNHGVYLPPDNVNATSQVASWNGTKGQDVSAGNGQTYVFFNDQFSVGGQNIPGVPFYTYTYTADGTSLWSSLALGRNSSFIDTALAAGTIPNKAWSLWTGKEFDDLDGLLILGGYDESRATSEFTEFEVNEGFGLGVEITGFEWQPDSGPAIDLMPDGTTQFNGLVEPYWDWIGFPPTSRKLFLETTNASVTDNWPTWSEKPQGTVVVTLSNGLKTTIPDTDLFYHPYGYNERGVLDTWNRTYYQAAMLEDQNYERYGFVWLGRPYLSQHLLVTDFDRGKWWLADAVTNKASATAGKLRPLCTGGPQVSVAGKTNVAAIAGGVCGGTSVLLVLAGVVVYLYRRRRQNRQSVTAELMASGPSSTAQFRHGPSHMGPPCQPELAGDQSRISYYEVGKHELDGPRSQPAEMSANISSRGVA